MRNIQTVDFTQWIDVSFDSSRKYIYAAFCNITYYNPFALNISNIILKAAAKQEQISFVKMLFTIPYYMVLLFPISIVASCTKKKANDYSQANKLAFDSQNLSWNLWRFFSSTCPMIW